MLLFLPYPCSSWCSLPPHEVASTVGAAAIDAVRSAFPGGRFAAPEAGDAPERGLAVVAENLALVELQNARARGDRAVPDLE